MNGPNARTLHSVALLVLLTGFVAAGTTPVAAGQDLKASFVDDHIGVDREAVNATLSITDAPERVTVRSSNVSEETLARMFDGRETDDGIEIEVPSDGNVTVRFPVEFRCSPGEYTIAVDDGERVAFASINGTAPATAPANFEVARQTVSEGGTARVPIEAHQCFDDDLTVKVGGRDSSIHLEVTFGPNGSGNTEGAIQFDTGNVTGPAAFQVEPDFVLRDVTVERTPRGGTLTPGTYDVELYSGNEAWDISALSVESGEASAPPTVTPTATDDPTASDEGPGAETTTEPSGTDPATDRQAEDTPGFTFVAGLLAVLSSAVLALRDR